jgi:citrate lyase subunit beta / citryl-CoA lyase
MIRNSPELHPELTSRVRRSWLMIPAHREDLIDGCWKFGADVIVLDLEDLVHPARKQQARGNIKRGIAEARRGGSEVFVRCDPQFLHADLEASVWRGLQGIILPKLTSTEQVVGAEAALARFEAERGVKQAGLIGEVNEMDGPRTPETSIEIHLALENAEGNQFALDLLKSSPRIRSVSLGRADLVMDLRPEPSGELHLMPFLMQRLIALANTAGIIPIGAWWQGNSRGLRANPADTRNAAMLGRSAGFKGAMCVLPEQIAALNEGFTPSESEIRDAEETRRAVEQAPELGHYCAEIGGVRLGSAASEGARVLLEWASLCAERDAFIRAAAERASIPREPSTLQGVQG